MNPIRADLSVAPSRAQTTRLLSFSVRVALWCAAALGCTGAGNHRVEPGAAAAGQASAGVGGGSSGASGSGGVSSTGGGTGGAGQGGGGNMNTAGSSGAGAGGSSGAGSGGAAGSAGSGVDDADRPGWTLVWRDEFDGPSGQAPDATKWTPRVGAATANKELEYYTDRAENLALDGNGFLVITARSEAYEDRDYTSARIETGEKFEQAYGRFESRIKIPRGQGIWPAFWIMGNNSEAGWPGRGELDIMENRGKEPTINVGAMHGPGYSGSEDFRAEYVVPEGLWQDFHVFSVEWEENVVRWYVDDNLYQTRTPEDLAERDPSLVWVYDHPFYVIMNVAVGGAFPGDPDDTTPFPQSLVADWVRVYQR
jgi:beta-glucanase (GH16 family)